jgi:hypothetical protein
VSDEIEPSGTIGSSDEPQTSSQHGPARRGRKIIVVAVAICLIGGGIGVAVAESGAPGNASTPAAAVNRLLDAADHSDLLGAIDAIAPGERNAIEPGFVGLVHQLERLDVLSPSTNLSDVGGLSLHFAGVKTATAMLSPTVAAVSITGGSVTGSLDAGKLPIGSFVRGLTRGLLPPASRTSTSSVSTGREAIVTEKVAGTWYVSLGYTIAYDVLRSEGLPGVSPTVSAAVSATGSSTPEGAVRVLLSDAAAFNLRGLLSDLPPGELGALQGYAGLFLGKAGAAAAKARSQVSVRITSLKMSSSAVAGGTLVQIGGIGLAVSYDGVTFSYKGGCLTYGYEGRSVRRCATNATSSAEFRRILAALPLSLRGLAMRFTASRPALGFVTVQEGSRWFVSPVATLFEDVNASLSTLKPRDLGSIASLLEHPAAAEALAHSLEQLLLGALASGSSSL